MKRRRVVNELARLLAKRNRVERQYGNDLVLKHFDPEREHLKAIDGWIKNKVKIVSIDRA